MKNCLTRVFTSTQALEIYKQFRAKTTDPRAKLRVALEITKELQIDIMVYSKTTEQRLTTLKKFSTSVPFSKFIIPLKYFLFFLHIENTKK